MKLGILYTSLVLVLILLTDPAWAQASTGQTMTLEDCLKLGIENNPSLKAARLSVSAAGQDIKIARADFLPSVSSSYSVSSLASQSSKGYTDSDYLDQDTRAFNIKLTQILYAGSRIIKSYEKAGIFEQVAKAEMNLEKLELISLLDQVKRVKALT